MQSRARPPLSPRDAVTRRLGEWGGAAELARLSQSIAPTPMRCQTSAAKFIQAVMLAATSSAVAPNRPFYGTASYNVDDGTTDTIDLNFSSSVESDLISALNSGSTLRLIVAPGGDGVAATYAGFGNDTFAGPTLVLDATFIPEPASLGLLGLSGLALLRRRRA